MVYLNIKKYILFLGSDSMEDDEILPNEFKDIINQITDMFSKTFLNNSDKLNNFSFSFSFNTMNPKIVKPYFDSIEYRDHYELIFEIPGIKYKDQVNITILDKSMQIIVEGDPKYVETISFNHEIEKEYDLTVKNRVLIVSITKKM